MLIRISARSILSVSQRQACTLLPANSLLMVLLLLTSNASFAEDDQWQHCGSLPDPLVVTDDDPRVHLFSDEQEVYADRVQYFEREQKAVAEGNVLVRDQDLDFVADNAELWTDTDTAKAHDVTYWYHSNGASGTAETATRVSEAITELDNATYSTCEFSDRAWELHAKHTILDREEGVGYSKNVVAKFKGVPFFYTPRLSFPLNDDRRTGFLAPKIGRNSSSGTAFETPFYWNIAPNKDAMLTPRYLSKRGTQMDLTGRYINSNSKGLANLQYLDDTDYDDDRYLISYHHQHNLGQGFKSSLLYNKVSDDHYFEDLSNSIGLTSTQRLERHANISYGGSLWGGRWDGLVKVQQYQIVDSNKPSSSNPYKRMPQVRVKNSYDNLPAGFELDTSSEWVAFDHDDKVDGNRTHLFGELSRPFHSSIYHFIPSMRFSHTRYDLSSGFSGDETPVRSLPSFSLDGGLNFERHTASGEFRQTLEPRLFYLYTPKREQNDIPLFDTGEYEFSFRQLFRTNRFNNADRVSDANQLTTAVTSRYLSNQTGREIVRASVGAIFYMDENEVTLKEEDRDNGDNNSDVAAELAINFNDRWSAISAALWDTQNDEFNRTNFNLRYNSASNFIFNIGHRYRREDFSQSDISIIYPMSEKWRAVGRWNYDFRDDRDLDLLAGIEYDTCCWNLRVVARRFTNDNDGDFNKSLELQWTLKGLTTIGSPLNEQLQTSIRGYEELNSFNN